MDIVTQGLLGAAVGGVVLGKRAGKKAILWGAIAGLIPDLDMFIPPGQNAVEKIEIHRGLTHSILFAVLLSPLLAYIAKKIHQYPRQDFFLWGIMFFLGLFTHALLDCLTTYGTKIFYPFSDHAVEWNIISFIDPFFSVPLLVGIGSALIIGNIKKGHKALIIGTGLSIIYLIICGINKNIATNNFKDYLEYQNIKPISIRTTPTLYNSVIWYCIAETKSDFIIGYSSVIDAGISSVQNFAQNEAILKKVNMEYEQQTIKEFTKGYYIVREKDTGVVIKDIRFGKYDFYIEDIDDDKFFYEYVILDKNGSPELFRKDFEIKFAFLAFINVVNKIFPE